MKKNNDLKLFVYSSGTTRVVDPRDEFQKFEGLSYETYYPGGLYGVCSLVVPKQAREEWVVQGAQRVVLANGRQTAYEGYVDDLTRSLDATQRFRVNAVGAWGKIMMRQGIHKPWCDGRISADVWPEPATAWSANDVSLLQNMRVDRLNRIRFTPKAVAFTTNQFHRVRYEAPTGQTIKRVTWSYDMQESTQAWSLLLYNETSAAIEDTVSASGTGNKDVTLATPASAIFFYFRADANQTAVSNGTIYGQVTSVRVYTETGAINATEIFKDIRAACTDLNSYEGLIGSYTTSRAPFITNGWQTYADILRSAAELGSSGTALGYGLRESERAATPNGEPVLFLETQPALTDYDYAVRLGEMAEGVEIVEDYSQIANYIPVMYKDERGYEQWVTPADDASLTDAASVADYGTRLPEGGFIQADTTVEATAITVGARYLAQWKDKRYRFGSPVRVRGVIRAKNAGYLPVSLCRAGKRVKIEDYLSGLNFLVTRTSYMHDDQVVELEPGPVGTMAGTLSGTRKK